MIKYFIVCKDSGPYFLVIANYDDVGVLLDHGYTIYPIQRYSVSELIFEENDSNG